ncbi:NHL repeat-containing protein, partial [Motilibacter aurantiacus]|uniref:hypothetical protein n=1 Tax=Motilibacter aurantiacus TaxID=2714955 RepID=UPI001407BAAF
MRPVLLAAVMAATSSMLAASIAAPASAESGAAVSAAAAPADLVPAVHICGEVDPARVVSAGKALPDPTVTKLVSGIRPDAIVWQANRLYVLDSGTRVLIYDASRTLVRTVPLGFEGYGLAVDPTGAFYVLNYPFEVRKFSADGA